MGLREEIFEQPAALRRLAARQQAVDEIAEAVASRRPSYIYLAARGTSDHAGLYAQYLFGAVNGLPVALAAPSLFSLYRQGPNLRDAWVIGISQSGESPDIVGVVEEGAAQGAVTLAITNCPESPLAQAADFVIDLSAGPETSIAATKTYTTELMAVALLSTALSRCQKRREELERIPEYVEQALELASQAERCAERYRLMDRCVVLGRGYSYATAREWALKLKELTYVPTDAYSPSDFRHGPIAVVDSGFPVFGVLHRGPAFDDSFELMQELDRQRSADLLVISNHPAAVDLSKASFQLPADLPEWLSPIVTIVPAQLFCLFLTQHKELDPETPRGLRKVTRTL